jgi:hypothetical protein
MILAYLVTPQSKSKIALCGKCLINKPEGSYRIKGTEHKDYLIVLKYAYRLLLKWRKGGFLPEITELNAVALYDSAMNGKPRLDFIESVSNVRPGLYINKEQLSYLKTNGMVVVCKSIILCVLTLILLPFSLTKLRAQAALVLHEIDEAANLVIILRANKIKTVYYSCSYEKDANAGAYLLMGMGFRIIKNPSEDPLYFNNQILIAHELGLCNPCQNEEVKAYSDTILINKTHKWYPEDHLKFLKDKTFLPAEKGVLGYYSGSSWLRIALNYNLVTGSFDPYTAEEECELHIAKFMAENPELTLRVFLHPLEKKHMELTKKHFEDIWPNVPYEFEDFDKHTTETFHRCEVAVTVFSGVMFYRYYAGYKGVMYCPYMPGFPLKNSLLDGVSAKSYQEFEQRINAQLGMSDTDFINTTLRGEYKYA